MSIKLTIVTTQPTVCTDYCSYSDIQTWIVSVLRFLCLWSTLTILSSPCIVVSCSIYKQQIIARYLNFLLSYHPIFTQFCTPPYFFLNISFKKLRIIKDLFITSLLLITWFKWHLALALTAPGEYTLRCFNDPPSPPITDTGSSQLVLLWRQIYTTPSVPL